MPLRFLPTNANNGWASVLAAAFLHRTHQGGFSGVAYNDLKWEWACDEPTRKLTRLAGLSWRHTKALAPAAEAPERRSLACAGAAGEAWAATPELPPLIWTGGGSRTLKVGGAPEVLARLPGVTIVEGLSLPPPDPGPPSAG